jgi:hypothetical protein
MNVDSFYSVSPLSVQKKQEMETIWEKRSSQETINKYLYSTCLLWLTNDGDIPGQEKDNADHDGD